MKKALLAPLYILLIVPWFILHIGANVISAFANERLYAKHRKMYWIFITIASPFLLFGGRLAKSQDEKGFKMMDCL